MGRGSLNRLEKVNTMYDTKSFEDDEFIRALSIKITKEIYELVGSQTLIVYEATRHLVKAGGKLLRPLLVLLGCKAVGGNIEKALPTAAGIELAHIASLMHDDIIDDVVKRRGVEAVHVKFGKPTAIVSGDLLLAKLFQAMAYNSDVDGVTSEQIVKVLEVASEACIQVCEGQGMDLDFVSRWDVAEDECVEMYRKKTAAAFSGSLAVGAILGGGSEREIKALYLAGEVPRLGELAKLAFLVVQDIVPTKNLQYAHVVLPATTFAEMDGTLTNLEGRVQRIRKVIPPVGLSRPGWMIVRDIAERMGIARWNYNLAADVMAEIASLIPAYKQLRYDTLGVGGAVRRFGPATKPQFVPFSLDEVPQLATDEFPLTLITERNLFYYHGASLTEQVKGMNLIKNEEVLQLSPSDATRLRITDGATVKVESSYGSAECVVQATSGIPEGTAFISINRVTGSALFPNPAPSTKACAIRIAERSRM